MKTLGQALSVLLPVFYMIVVFYYGHIFFGRAKKLEDKSTWILIFLLVIHFAQIIIRAVAIESMPLATKFDALSVLAFILLVVYLIIELTVKNKGTGFFVLMLAFIIQSISSVLYSWDLTHNPLLSNPIYAVHVIFTILGYTAICVSALYALMYVMLNHNIRHHQLGLVYDNLPPLTTLERMSIRSIQIGIISLGFGLLLGHIRAGDVLGTYWPMDVKVIFSDLIWISYALGYLIAQFRKWRGRWMAYLSMAGFGILVFANITIIFFIDTFHQFQ